MPNDNVAASHKKKVTPMVVFGTIAALGAAIVALNSFTGLNFRPAWGYEIEQLVESDNQQVASNNQTQQRLDMILEIQDSTSRTILQLSKGQYELRLNQIDRERREIRRELAEYQTRAQNHRNNGERVPDWLSERILDSEENLDELDSEKDQIQNKLLELE